MKRVFLLYLMSICLTSCSFAPKFHRPAMPIPAQYKEMGPWISVDARYEKPLNKPWWAIFQDKTLNELQERVSCNNYNLKIAVDRYLEARAMAEVTRSALYPSIDALGTIARQQNSKNYVLGTTNKSAISVTPTLFNTFMLTGLLTYEIDVWGRVRNSVVAGDSLAKASAYDLAAINLSLHGELAADYFQLRGYDQNQVVLDRTVAAYTRALYLTKKRYQGGMVAVGDLAQATLQLDNAKTAATNNRLKRAELEHAIAILIGEMPANFSLPPSPGAMHLVTLLPTLPSTLLLHRPDVAAACLRVKAANAQIGVARAAFFPKFNLFALLGVESTRLSNLFTGRSLLWSLGPSSALAIVEPEISQVIFEGFKYQALLKKAKSSYFELVNTYKETVLQAFKEVEDGLVALHRLDEEKKTQVAALNAAKQSLLQAQNQYQGGLVTYLEVVIYENQTLQTELDLIAILTRRQLASVQLIKALGGCWYAPSFCIPPIG